MSSRTSNSEHSPISERSENALIFSPLSSDDPSVWEGLQAYAPGVACTIVHSERDYRALISSLPVDLVVFDDHAPKIVEKMYLPELRFLASTPGILVVSPPSDPLTVASLYNAGCHRVIHRLDSWIPELGQAVRALRRLRRAEEAYEMTRARLTEMNHLLEEKNRRLNEFSMALAHDIRGPLGGIAMKLEYILDCFPTELPPRARDLIERSLGSSRRLTDIVQAMYEYAKLGKEAAHMSHVSLATLVEETVRDLDFDQKLDVKVGIGDLPNVWGNSALLRRVFGNLITNSVKYSDKPEVIVNIGTRAVEERTLARYADIFVSDNGPGITPDDQQALFRMFNRGSQEGGSREGLGMGLALVQRIVELHYGQISVQSDLGQGTNFLLSLPLEPPAVLV